MVLWLGWDVRRKEECCGDCGFVLASAVVVGDGFLRCESREEHGCFVDHLEEAVFLSSEAAFDAVQIPDSVGYLDHCLAVVVVVVVVVVVAAASVRSVSQVVQCWVALADLEEVERLLARWMVEDGSVVVLHWVEVV